MKSLQKIWLSLFFIMTVSYSQFTEDALRYSQRGDGVGARAMGMGNAYIGVSDDYSAAVWNPAGLAQLRRLEFTGGISNYGLTNDASYLGTKTSDNTAATSLDNLGFVFPFPTERGSLVFAVGYNRLVNYASVVSFNGFNSQSSIIPTLYDSDVRYDVPFNTNLTNNYGYTAIQGNVNQSGTLKESGRLGQWSFSGAIDVEENISIGISLNVLNGSYNSTRNYLEADTKNMFNNASANLPIDSAYLRFNKFYYDSFLHSDLSGGGVTFGAMYRSDVFRVGLIAKSPTSITIKETYSYAGQSVFDNAGTWQPYYDSSASRWITSPYTQHSTPETPNEYGISSPWTLGGGFSWYVVPQLLLAVDIEHTDWTQIEWKDNADLEKGNIDLQKNFRAVTSYRVGAEFDIPKTDVRVRGGYSMTPSPYKNDPSSYGHTLITGGAGILLQRNVVLDAAVAFGSFKSFQYQYSGNTSRTDESKSTTQVNVTLGYRF
ncbi:MAG: outer membrane protein transport protein [Bacteroidota bacterium]|nr:outer membrane protein transport protein [Bacteroidota bacterium]